MASGDASSYIEATNDTFVELAESLVENDTDKIITVSKLKASVKNITTDRHVVNKCYHKLFENDKLKAIRDLNDGKSQEEIE